MLLSLFLCVNIKAEKNNQAKFPRIMLPGWIVRSNWANRTDIKGITWYKVPGTDKPILTEEFLDIAKDLNCTGVGLSGWSPGNGGWVTKKSICGMDMKDVLALAEEKGLNVIIVNSAWGYPYKYYEKAGFQKSLYNQEVRSGDLELLKKIAERWKDYPAFKIVQFDEPYYPGGYTELDRKAFIAYLKEKFTSAQLKNHGIKDIENVKLPRLSDAKEMPFLWTAYRDFIRKSFANYVKEERNLWHKIAPGKKFSIIISPYSWPYRASCAKIGPVVDTISVDLYWRASPNQGYYYELLERTNPGNFQPVIGLYVDTPLTAKRDIYLSAMHSDGVLLFCFDSFWKRQGPSVYNSKDVDKKMYNAVKESLGNIEKIEDYLYQAKTIPSVAIGVKEYTQDIGLEFYNILAKAHIPVSCFYLDNLTPSLIKDNKLIILHQVEAISNKEAKIITEWVKRGGILLLTNRTGNLNQYNLHRRKNIFDNLSGIKREKLFALPKASLSFNNKELTLYTIPSDMVDFFKDDPAFSLVKIVPSSNKTKVIFEWKDKTPAVTIHPFGQGYTIFLNFPSLKNRCYSKEWLIFFKKIILDALEKTKKPFPIVVNNCPEEIEVNLREQKNNRIIHLLSFNNKEVTYNGIEIRLRVPTGYRVDKLFSPLTGKSLNYQEGKGEIRFIVPEFKMYYCIVSSLKRR